MSVINLRTEIIEISSGRNGIIAANKNSPYVSIIDFGEKMPEKDYLILFKNPDGNFTGDLKDVHEHEIEIK